MDKGTRKKILTPRKMARFFDTDEEEVEKFSDSDSISIASDDSVKDPDFEYFSGFSDNELEGELHDLCLEEENLSSSDDDEVPAAGETSAEGPQWSDFVGRQKTFQFTGAHGIQVPVSEEVTPYEVWNMFVDTNIMKHLVEQTNLYARQQKEKRMQPNSRRPLTPNSRLQKWVDTNEAELKKFLGIILWMGLNKRGRMEEYWSTDPLFVAPITSKGNTLSRNRFQLLLNCFHFADNELVEESNRLAKIQPLIDLLTRNFQEIYVPGENFVIDETLIPWRGRLIFRQYIPNKTHRYGIKLFKLCSEKGYTYNLSVYSGQRVLGERDVGLAEQVCEQLSTNLLNEGRTLYVDNFYTNYNLAHKFLQKKTHVVGTVRSGRKKLAKEVHVANLKRGEVIAREDQNGITFLKWKDKRDVRMLSTKHTPELCATPEHLEETEGKQKNRGELSRKTLMLEKREEMKNKKSKKQWKKREKMMDSLEERKEE